MQANIIAKLGERTDVPDFLLAPLVEIHETKISTGEPTLENMLLKLHQSGVSLGGESNYNMHWIYTIDLEGNDALTSLKHAIVHWGGIIGEFIITDRFDRSGLSTFEGGGKATLLQAYNSWVDSSKAKQKERKAIKKCERNKNIWTCSWIDWLDWWWDLLPEFFWRWLRCSCKPERFGSGG